MLAKSSIKINPECRLEVPYRTFAQRSQSKFDRVDRRLGIPRRIPRCNFAGKCTQIARKSADPNLDTVAPRSLATIDCTSNTSHHRWNCCSNCRSPMGRVRRNRLDSLYTCNLEWIFLRGISRRNRRHTSHPYNLGCTKNTPGMLVHRRKSLAGTPEMHIDHKLAD